MPSSSGGSACKLTVVSTCNRGAGVATSLRSEDSRCGILGDGSVSKGPRNIVEGTLESLMAGDSDLFQSGLFSAPGIKVGMLSDDILLIARCDVVSDMPPNAESKSEYLNCMWESDIRTDSISDKPENR